MEYLQHWGGSTQLPQDKADFYLEIATTIILMGLTQ